MAFWNRGTEQAGGRPIWELTSEARGTLRCVLHQDGPRVTLVVTSETADVATCTHQTRREAIAHAGFLLDRFTAYGWQVRSGMGDAAVAPRRGTAMMVFAGEMPSPV
jgi:hypothetical protein